MFISKIEGKDPAADNNGWITLYINVVNPPPIALKHIAFKAKNKTILAIVGIKTLNGAATFGGTELGNLIQIL